MFKEDISLEYYQLKSVTGHTAWCNAQINEHWSERLILKEYGVCSKGKEQSWNLPATTIWCRGKQVQEQYYTIRISVLEIGGFIHHQLHHSMYFWSLRSYNRKKIACPIQNHLRASIHSGITFFPKYASAVSFILPRTIAEISSGANNFSPCDVVTSMWGLLFFSFTCKIGSSSCNWHLLLNKRQFWVYCRIQWSTPYCQQAERGVNTVL